MKEPTWLDIEGVDVSEYPSAGISVGSTIIHRRPMEEMPDNIGHFDVVVMYDTDGLGAFFKNENNKPTMFIAGRYIDEMDYASILMHVSDIIRTFQRLRSGKLRVFFKGIGNGKLLNVFHRLHCHCYGQELDEHALIKAKELLCAKEIPWT